MEKQEQQVVSSVEDGNPIGEMSERQFNETLDVLLEMTTDDDSRTSRTSPLSESLLCAATSAVLGEVATLQPQKQSQSQRKAAPVPLTATLTSPSVAAAPMPSLSSSFASPFPTTTTTNHAIPFSMPSITTTGSLYLSQQGVKTSDFGTPATTTAGLPKLLDTNATNSRKRHLSLIAPISEDEEDWSKRRNGRNAREQHRAQQITQQIAQLRVLLQSFNLQFKPDKFTTLLTATNYIQELQKQSSALSTEHKKLLKTLQETTERLHHPLTDAKEGAESGVQYRGVFQACPSPLCLTNLDGRFLDANPAFEKLNGVNVNDIVAGRKSIFNLLHRSDIEGIFCAMSQLLEYPAPPHAKDTFARNVTLVVDKQQSPAQTMALHVSLVRSETGLPRFFNCVMLPASPTLDGLQTTG